MAGGAYAASLSAAIVIARGSVEQESRETGLSKLAAA